jgi:hypothetical protein
MKKILAALAAMLLAGCTTTPAATPMEAHLNRYAAAQAVAMNCPAYGGYSSVAAMRSDADKNLAKARSLGARDADIKKAQERMNAQLSGAIFMVGPIQACSSFVNGLAWAGSAPAKITPKPKS